MTSFLSYGLDAAVTVCFVDALMIQTFSLPDNLLM